MPLRCDWCGQPIQSGERYSAMWLNGERRKVLRLQELTVLHTRGCVQRFETYVIKKIAKGELPHVQES